MMRAAKLVGPDPDLALVGAPQFLIIGAAKSGTTTLYDDLAAHPDANMPRDKEPDILHRAESPDGVAKLWRGHFSGPGEGLVCGEGSTPYTMAPEREQVAGLARAAMGAEGRVIYIMRDPVKRVLSQLAHDYHTGCLSPEDFDTAALQGSRYIDVSDYAKQLTPWISAFGRMQVLPLVFEDLVANRREVVQRAAQFVGLDPLKLPFRTEVSNVSGELTRPRSALVEQGVRSHMYRRHLRPYLPNWLLVRAKLRFGYQKEPVEVVLSDATMAKLRARLAHVPGALARLGIDVGPWWERADG